jgi:hypothetical protein
VWERGKKKEERRKLIGKTEVIKVKYICIKGDNVFRQERFVSKYSIRIADGGKILEKILRWIYRRYSLSTFVFCHPDSA